MAKNRFTKAQALVGSLRCTGTAQVDGASSFAAVTATTISGTALTVTSVVATGNVALTGNLTITDTKNIVLSAVTGTQFGTAAGQKLAFYGAAPLAQQTGVAVTAGGIHAALVALGLITA